MGSAEETYSCKLRKQVLYKSGFLPRVRSVKSQPRCIACKLPLPCEMVTTLRVACEINDAIV